MTRSKLIAASDRLDAFAKDSGFDAQPPRYITGNFNIALHDGEILYSDEAHLYCADCATSLQRRAITLLGPQSEDDHFIYCADTSLGEDGPVYCATCGVTLDYQLTEHGCTTELEHYEENPSADISPQEAS